MVLKTNDYKGDERRSGHKLKLSGRDYIKILIIFTTAVLWIGKLQWEAQALADETDKHGNTIVALEQDNDIQDQKIVGIQKDIIHIKETTEKMQNVQQQMLKAVYRIEGKLDE